MVYKSNRNRNGCTVWSKLINLCRQKLGRKFIYFLLQFFMIKSCSSSLDTMSVFLIKTCKDLYEYLDLIIFTSLYRYNVWIIICTFYYNYYNYNSSLTICKNIEFIKALNFNSFEVEDIFRNIINNLKVSASSTQVCNS